MMGLFSEPTMEILKKKKINNKKLNVKINFYNQKNIIKLLKIVLC